MLTRQEIMTKAFNGLRSQNFKRCVGTDGYCLYDNGDMHCAVGWLVPNQGLDDALVGGAEAGAERAWHMNLGNLQDLVAKEDIGFLNVLQNAHDSASNPVHMEKSFRMLAARYSLEIQDAQ